MNIGGHGRKEMKTIILIIMVLINFSLFGQPKKSIEKKHVGFFGRGTIGLGSTNITESANSSLGKIDIDISGLSADVNIRIGYSIIENLQLYGVYGANIITDPKYEINGIEATTTTSTRVNLLRYGAGATYYFMPHNIYVSFDVTSGQNEIEANNMTSKSDRGVIFNFGAGKEWWVSKDWGLGAAFYFYTGSVNDTPFEGQTPEIKNTGFGIAFSATFN